MGGSKGVSSVIMGRESRECCLECGRNVRGRKCCLSKQAGISIKDRLFCLSLEGKMEKERQVLTSWQVCFSLSPSVSYLLTLYQFCFCGISEEKVLAVWSVLMVHCQHFTQSKLHCFEILLWIFKLYLLDTAAFCVL